MFTKRNVFISFVIALLLLVISYIAYQLVFPNRNAICGPGGCYYRTLKAPIPKYQEQTGYSSQSYIYECSRPIKMVSNTIDIKGQYVGFVPVDPEEARVFCHTNAIIEYKGKLTVLQKPEVLEMISKYDYKDISIKALEFEYIKDENFVHRLLPQYKDEEIGCIIVVETPNEKKVYLEDEELETFEEMDYNEFEKNLESVSESDRKLFLENLQ